MTGDVREVGYMRIKWLYSLLASGLVLATGTGVALAANTSPGHTIAAAGTLTIGGTTNGGGGPADFWKVTLRGGDAIQFISTTPKSSTYVFALYTPGTTDANFASATSFSSATTNFNGQSVFDLQAPYNGTFILAVCQGPNVSNFNCSEVDTGGADNPMDAYSFKTSLVNGGVSEKVAAAETKAAPSIAKAPIMSIGHFEAGGANPADFWKVTLRGGDVVQIASTTANNSTYVFALYPPGTNGTNFRRPRRSRPRQRISTARPCSTSRRRTTARSFSRSARDRTSATSTARRSTPAARST